VPYGEVMARLAFLGTPEMAVAPLRALTGAGHDVALVVTRPDKRRGRGGYTTPSPVKAAALELRIIPAVVLEKVPLVNLHFSLLPRWRGAAPLERAILAGDRETGVCLMKIEEGLDTGPVYARRAIPLDDDITLQQLRARLVELGCDLLLAALADGVDHLPAPESQVGEPTIAERITSEDLQLDWSQPAGQVHRVVRLGRAWTTFRGKRLTVLEATIDVARAQPGGALRPGAMVGAAVVTGDGVVQLIRVKPESRSPMSADEWLRGVRPENGERLGTD